MLMNVKKILTVIGLLLFANILVAVLLVNAVSEKKGLEEQFSDSVAIQKELKEEIQILLPDTIYAANGITMELYNSQVTNIEDEISRYNIRWNCDIGENLERRFSVSANDENLGTYELRCEIYNNELELVAEKACTLVIAEADMDKREAANKIQKISDVPENCLEQAECSVDREYNGTLDELKPEGLVQLQDIVYSVLCGN